MSVCCWHKAYSQYVYLKRDTITIYGFSKVDTETKAIDASFSLLESDSILYDALNFSFSSYNCEEYFSAKENLFKDDYNSLVEKKTLKKFIRHYRRKHSIFLTSDSDILIPPGIKECLYNEGGNFIFKKQRMIAIFLIVKCEAKRGIFAPVFCESIVNKYEIPVILKIEKLL